MKYTVFAALLLAAPIASAATIVGTLASGGGIDDMSIRVRDETGRTVSAYCDGRCGDIFGHPDRHDIVELEAKHKGRQVRLDYATESNRGRIAGPGEDERLAFVKKFEFLRATGKPAAPNAHRHTSTTTVRSIAVPGR